MRFVSYKAIAYYCFVRYYQEIDFKPSIVKYNDVQATNRQIGTTSEAEKLLLVLQRFLKLPAMIAVII